MKTRKMKKIVVLCVAVMMITIAGCVQSVEQEGNKKPTIIENTITDFGNGVYYFDYVTSEFGNQLSQIIVDHQKLKVVTITPNDRGGHGYTTGYFVITEPRIPCPCDTISTKK